MTTKYWENGAKTAARLYLLVLVQAFYVMAADSMGCKYGERGSLTAVCINATSNLFKDTSYRFDHLDETLMCLNCTLSNLATGTFDISGNKIQILNLSNSRIESVEEKAFTGLVFTEQLILADNSISRFEVGAFHGARRIKELYLENALTAPLPNFVFQELRLLRKLYLNNNSLASIETKTFAGLVNLEVLDLSYNKLTGLNESLYSLNKLKQLFLNNNEISRIGTTDFQGLPNLLEVNLANNHIGALKFSSTGSFSLRKLNLSNNHLGNEVVKVGTFEHLNNLEILDLSLNWFKLIRPKLFQGLYNLRELNLSNNTLKVFYSGAFSGLPSLWLLNVSHNNIFSAQITGILSLHRLHVIDFSDNLIPDFDIVTFRQRAPRIKDIDLSNNLLGCPKRRELEAYFKNISIAFKLDLKNCPQLTKDEYNQIFKELENEIEGLAESSPIITTVKILFLVLIIALVGLLFYIHFYIILRRK